MLATNCGSRDRPVSYIREALAAGHVLTLMGLLAGVSTDMYSQSAPLNEAFAAAGNSASVRTLVSVNLVVALKVRLAVEALLCQVPLAINRGIVERR